MGRIYEKLKTINKLYDKAENSIGTKNYDKHYLALNNYLDEFGLIKRTDPKRASKFLVDLQKELPTLKKPALNNVYTTFNELLWKLQTGDIIPISELIYIKKLSFPVQVIELINTYKKSTKKKSKKSSTKKKSSSEKKSSTKKKFY